MRNLFFVILVLGCLQLNAQLEDSDSSAPSPSSDTVIFPKKEKNDKGKRRVPSRNYVYCEYGAGFISLALPAGVQSASFTLSYGDDPLYYGVYFASDRYVTIPDLSGEIAIEITADNGSVYAGILNF